MIVAYLTADIEALKRIFSGMGGFNRVAPFFFQSAAVPAFGYADGLHSIVRLRARGFPPGPVRARG